MTKKLMFPASEWAVLVNETFDKILELSVSKGAEYSGDINRLQNFVQNAEPFSIEPELVWAIYAGKHYDAIRTYINDITTGRERVRSEPITGRIDDLIVYLLLLKAMCVAREAAPHPGSQPPKES